MRRVRLAFLLALLGVSLVALRHRSRLQAWAYGVDAGPRRQIGKPVLELPPSLRTLEGKPLLLASLRGRVTLLHFWTFD